MLSFVVNLLYLIHLLYILIMIYFFVLPECLEVMLIQGCILDKSLVISPLEGLSVCTSRLYIMSVDLNGSILD